MARKRGGLAGLYDRNKGKFRTAGTLVGTGLGALVGGPAGAKIGGTLAGAAFRGFDRPGKGGIGFDVSQGLQGAAEGYGTAALATGAYGGAKGLLSPKAAGAAAKNPLADFPMGIGFGLGGQTGGESGGQPSGTQPMRWRDVLKQPQVLASGVQGLLGMLPDAKSAAMEEQTKLGQGQLDLQRAQFEEEKRRAQMEEERRRRVAELLMPLMQQSFGQYYGGGR